MKQTELEKNISIIEKELIEDDQDNSTFIYASAESVLGLDWTMKDIQVDFLNQKAMELDTSPNIFELCDRLNQIDDICNKAEIKTDSIYEMNLFSHDEMEKKHQPENMTGVFAWDEKNILIYTTEWVVEKREE